MDSKRTKQLKAFDRLLTIMDELRTNCPWDKKQTFASLRHLTIEETYELSEALLSGDLNEVKNELGDLLLHIVFYAKMGSEQKAFDIGDVANAISKKLIDRHPHIYGDVEVKDEADVKKNWEKLKLKEGNKGVLSGVPKSLPSLVMASRMQDKAAGIGFDWKSIDGVKDKIKEELSELDHEINHGTKEKITDELGDVFFSLVNYARFLKINPDDALSSTNRRFRSRFEAMEKMAKQQGQALDSLAPNQWEQLWQAAKKEQG
ncbi:nucleoside triphosphate pyrophosphohydrolase [Flavobacteriaceae bacterium]|jgi:XTP/dITP diphosphohydrolase|nr:nucleoside triphosphate pyrophosphohydrolase [Flavobacteriaceae bacterium]MDG1722878.1 nucleoside triphosphate pyrophosphohydrolase [Flavobacteriaceae bacterium]MDG2290868.1 nucleoside triphosphate pyrophosphohydrolase [Flavobacteriaceae bacterium]